MISKLIILSFMDIRSLYRLPLTGKDRLPLLSSENLEVFSTIDMDPRRLDKQDHFQPRSQLPESRITSMEFSYRATISQNVLTLLGMAVSYVHALFGCVHVLHRPS